jgi:cell wall-associated protease
MNTTIKITLAFLWSGIAAVASAQHIPNWQNKDLQKDSLFGISTEKAYTLLQGKTPQQVIVAVIDAGVDTLHEDLQGELWINPKKKKGDNGTYGWSYIGSARGNVHYDNLELTRQVRAFQSGDTTRLGGSDLMAYHAEKKDFDQMRKEATDNLKGFTNFLAGLDAFTAKMGKSNPSLADLKAFGPQDDFTRFVINAVSGMQDFKAYRDAIVGSIWHFREQTDYQLNLAYDPRPIVGDRCNDPKQRHYGSPDNMGPDATHGTHVAGIIAGIRGNALGADGIANDVKIMAIRVVPNGDERDKDIANAIRYAADHGAKVINMSFGKAYSPDKKVVDAAVKYAMEKDVLLVQAAGNDNRNIDSLANYPSRNYLNGKQADNWIVVGASGLKNDNTLKAPFSNYGRLNVDVFAPGVQIYSAIPGSKYDYFDGTSMACPVVVGLAALIREYYPKFTAQQVKDIILQSVVKVNHIVRLQSGDTEKKVPFSALCSSGGIVNAYQALQLAASYH